MNLSIYANLGVGGESGVGVEDAVRLRKRFPSLATAAESRLRNRKQRLEKQIRQLEGTGKSATALRQELANAYSALKPFASDPLRQATAEERKRYQRYLEISRSSADQLGMRLHRANLDLEDYRSETKAGRASGFGGRTVRMVDGSVERWDLVTDQIAKALGVAVRDVPRLVGGIVIRRESLAQAENRLKESARQTSLQQAHEKLERFYREAGVPSNFARR
ncbi:MAG: hypothetical protein KF784_02270 [Fimbriimonadaceae bacterium]|nr:hypothetical protein [Fimbriimonadaceae bacterium]